MKNRKFINREQELSFLEEKYKAKEQQLIVLYGRRRVGKTELIKEFIKNKSHIYFLADKRGTLKNANRFIKQVASFFGEKTIPSVENFDGAFEYIKQRISERKMKSRIVVVIDEFSYLVERDKDIPSVLQVIWDDVLEGSNIYLILCGSSISMMYEGALSYKSPLYGRRTGQWKINPIKFKEVIKFFPKYKFVEQIIAFSIFGNIPAYLTIVRDDLSIKENIYLNILRKGEPLYDEPEILLKEELRDPSTYLSILEAMTTATKLSEIASKAGIQAKDMPKYLKILQNLELVEKTTPITEKKSKKTNYKIKDPFFDFWFKFIFPAKSDLESGEMDKVLKIIQEKLNLHVSRFFENVCKEAILEMINKKFLFEVEKIGSHPYSYRENGERKTGEIDIIALNENEKKIIFGECKWQEVDGEKILSKLKEKSKYVDWYNKDREEYFVIFAKSFRKKIKEKNLLLFDLKDLEKIFKR